MGLVLEAKETTAHYTIQFGLTDAPSVISVEPGTYSLKKLVFAAFDYSKEGEKDLPESLLTKSFLVEPGKAYYLGDMAGRGSTSSSVFTATHSWYLESIKDNYENTTREFRVRFSNFQHIGTRHAFKSDFYQAKGSANAMDAIGLFDLVTRLTMKHAAEPAE